MFSIVPFDVYQYKSLSDYLTNLINDLSSKPINENNLLYLKNELNYVNEFYKEEMKEINGLIPCEFTYKIKDREIFIYPIKSINYE